MAADPMSETPETPAAKRPRLSSLPLGGQEESSEVAVAHAPESSSGRALDWMLGYVIQIHLTITPPQPQRCNLY